MKHLKKFNKIFEGRLNAIEGYIQDFIDLGFKLDENDKKRFGRLKNLSYLCKTNDDPFGKDEI
jgi:hypothetical protein